MSSDVPNIVNQYGKDLLNEIHFLQVQVNILLEVADQEQDRILRLWNRVITEIERRQHAGKDRD